MPFHSGPLVDLEALKLVLQMEDRGFTVQVHGDVLTVRPSTKLTAHDRALIREWKDELLQIVGDEAPRLLDRENCPPSYGELTVLSERQSSPKTAGPIPPSRS